MDKCWGFRFQCQGNQGPCPAAMAPLTGSPNFWCWCRRNIVGDNDELLLLQRRQLSFRLLQVEEKINLSAFCWPQKLVWSGQISKQLLGVGAAVFYVCTCTYKNTPNKVILIIATFHSLSPLVQDIWLIWKFVKTLKLDISSGFEPVTGDSKKTKFRIIYKLFDCEWNMKCFNTPGSMKWVRNESNVVCFNTSANPALMGSEVTGH